MGSVIDAMISKAAEAGGPVMHRDVPSGKLKFEDGSLVDVTISGVEVSSAHQRIIDSAELGLPVPEMCDMLADMLLTNVRNKYRHLFRGMAEYKLSTHCG